MEANDRKRISQLEQLVDDIAAGLYRIPIGPGAISNKALKPKSVTAGTISVADLESVNAKTGSLTVNGALSLNTSGSIAIGKTSYADNATGGLWVGYTGGTYMLNLGNSTYSMKWDGSALNITGAITAKSGAIGGFSIGPTDLTTDAGATGFASSGGHRLWVGNATPGSAPFRVTNAGVLNASGATITGDITATSGTLGTLSITGTLNMASGSIFKSGMTAHGTGSGWWFENNAGTPIMAIGSNSSSGFSFNGTNMYLFGQAVIGTIEVSTNGNIRSGASSYASGTGWILEYNGGTPRFRVGTATSGTNYLAFDGTNIEMRGKLKFGSGGNSYLDGTIQHFELTGSNTAVIEMKAGAANPAIQIQGFANSTDAQSTYSATATNAGTLRAGSVFVNATAADNTTNVTVRASKAGVTQSEFVAEGDGYAYVGLGDSAGAKNFEVRDSSGAMVLGVNSNGELIRPITNDATALGAYYGRVPIYINGSLKYLAVYS